MNFLPWWFNPVFYDICSIARRTSQKELARLMQRSFRKPIRSFLLLAAATWLVSSACAQAGTAMPHPWIASFCLKEGNASTLRHFMIMPDSTVRSWAPGEEPSPVAGLDHVIALSAQSWFMLILKADGTVWVWGSNGNGELGNAALKRMTHTDTPLQVPSLTHIKAISTASSSVGNSCYALRDDGSVWSWGYAGLGMGGYGATSGSQPGQSQRGAPVRVAGIQNAVAIAGAMALLSDGTVMTWGEGRHGRLGNGTTTNAPEPVPVSGLRNVVAIASRNDGALALLADGTVWAWGNNYKGQNGPNGHVDRFDEEKTCNAVPVPVTGINTAVAIDADAVCLALLRDGTVKAWGWGAVGGMGRGVPGQNDFNAVPRVVPGVSRVKAIKAGDGSGFALEEDGTLMGWGCDMVSTGIYHQTWKAVVIAKRK